MSVAVGGALPENIRYGILIGAGCSFIAPLVGGGIYRLFEKYGPMFFEDKAYPWIVGVCVAACIAIAVAGGVRVHHDENIVPSSETTVSETRYQVAVGTSVGRVSGAVRGNRWHTAGSVSEGEYYKVFVYGEENGATTIAPMVLPARDTRVIVTDQEGFLVKVEETFYLEDRNYDPAQKEVNYVETTYRLYINEADVVGLAGT